MSDIVEFLTARYDGEQRIAERAAKSAGWRDGTPEPDWLRSGGDVMAAGVIATGCHGEMDEPIADHIARHDPARVLADIAAKRKRLALYVEAKEQLAQALKDAPWKDDPAFAHTYARERININELSGKHSAYLMSVRLDAAQFAEYSDFDPAWRIDG